MILGAQISSHSLSLAEKFGMCLTIPKKVVEIQKNGQVVLELFDGARQTVKTIVGLEIGDFCLTQQNVVIEKIASIDAEQIFKILKGGVVS